MKRDSAFSHRVSLLVVFFVFLACSGLLKGQQNPEPLLHQQNQQKIFVHFDKENYAAGETIWMKGYLVNASDHSPVEDSANVYLELWNLMGEKVRELIFKPRRGSFHGQIALPEDMRDGNYAFRAYTDQMLKQEEASWFRKYLYISNPDFANQIDNDTRKYNREFNKSLEELRDATGVEFFPEGGSLVEGLESRVVIKVSDGLGKGKSVEGRISDQDGVYVADFETNDNGLGLFTIKPEGGESYSAVLPGARRGSVRIPLPPVDQDGFVMQARKIEGDLEVMISGTQDLSGHSLMAQSRGEINILYSGFSVEKVHTSRFPLDSFHTGITKLVLLSGEGMPLAERLVFINHDDQIYFDINARVIRSDEDTALDIEVMASDEEGDPVSGNYSVAVQYGEVGERTRYDNIFSHLLLGSDLEDWIESPAQYFDYSMENQEDRVGMLMISQSWQDFSPGEALDESGPLEAFQPSYGIDVSGALVSQKDHLGISDAEVRLRVVENPSQTFQARTDGDGTFIFEELQLEDVTMVEVIPPMIAGRQLPEVLLDTTGRVEQGIPPLVFVPRANTLMQQITERGEDWSRPGLALGGSAPGRGGQLFGTPDQTIFINDNEPYTSLIEILRDKAIGVSVSPNGFITIRGATSINYQNAPLFFVDGIESQGTFYSLHPRDVGRIEIFRGASTAVFGARGAAGAVAAYTRKRDYESESMDSNMFLVNGFHVPVEFYNEASAMVQPDSINTVKTVFWKPMLIIGEDGAASFRFRPLPGVTQYRIIIQGVGKDGKVGYAEFILGN